MDELRLRPVIEADLGMFARFATEPGLIGLDWAGFRDAQKPAKQFAEDGFLGPEGGRLIVEAGSEGAGFVAWWAGSFTAGRRALEKAGFRLEGVVRATEFRAGQWRDGHLYSKLRDDPTDYDRADLSVQPM